MCGLGVQRCQSFASSWSFFLSGVSPASRKIFTLRNTCYLVPPSSCHFGEKTYPWFRDGCFLPIVLYHLPTIICHCILIYSFYEVSSHIELGLNLMTNYIYDIYFPIMAHNITHIIVYVVYYLISNV
jgi:hypothetical protein